MEYISGKIPNELKKVFYYQIENEFILPVSKKRLNELRLQPMSVLELESFDLDLFPNDIIVFRYFNTEDDYPAVRYNLYIDYILRNGEKILIGKETTTTNSFIDRNKILFKDCTKQCERDNRLEKLLN